MKAQDRDRLVVVSARELDDLLELSRLAADRLEGADGLIAKELRGSAAAVRRDALMEP